MWPAILSLGILLPTVHAREVVLQNDQAWDDTYDASDEVVHLDFPECAATVLEPSAKDLPLTIDSILVYLGSNLGNQDRQIVVLTLAMQVLEEGEDPRLMGYTDWTWPETAFWVTVSSEYYNALNLDDPDSGIYPLTLTEGRLAVFICTADPEWKSAGDWPCTTEGKDCSGVVVETSSPSEGSWFYNGLETVPLAEATGTSGAWVIRAVGQTAGSDTALVLSSILPNEAPLGEVVDVTLTGENFEKGVTATIGGLEIASLIGDDTTLEGRSPSGLPAGAHDLVVHNPDGESAILEEAFLVVVESDSAETEDSKTDSEDDEESDRDGDEKKGCGCAISGARDLELLPLLGALLLLRRRGSRTKNRR